jgi:hypothetical protein
MWRLLFEKRADTHLKSVMIGRLRHLLLAHVSH